MLPVELVLTLFATLATVQCMASKPAFHYAIELQSCESTPSMNATVTDSCVALCQPVQDARQLCNGAPDCTCDKAPPQSVQTCLQCHIDARPDLMSRREAILDIPSRVARYSFVCNALSPSESPTNAPPLSSTSDHPAVQVSELDELCVYGLPDIVIPQPSTFGTAVFEKLRNPWLTLIFVAMIIIFLAQSYEKFS
ncbi:unnamed protein product [Somion occarium]|uniref:Uncharacterized protein n=1 Tax=Somion occarium TaxID=3059160 RepID=A0ABP1CST6_9APHY